MLSNQKANLPDMTETFVFHCVNVPAMRGGVALTEPVSFSLAKGDYIQLRGPNGSGKSTLLRQIAGLVPVEDGSLSLSEKPYRPHDPDISFQMAYLGHRDGLHGDLTGYENWRLLTGGKSDNKPIDPLYERQLSSYSAGQRQRLSLLTLSFDADLWLLDEPSSSLDADNLLFLQELMTRYLAKGGRIIAATHHDLAQNLVKQCISLQKVTL